MNKNMVKQFSDTLFVFLWAKFTNRYRLILRGDLK